MSVEYAGCPCGRVTGAFTKHVCAKKTDRPELGSRIKGPGFFMRWRRRPFYFGPYGSGAPTYLETTSPFLENTRAFRPVKNIARECIEHDRACTINQHSKIARFLARDGIRHAAECPKAYRKWLGRMAFFKATWLGGKTVA